MKANIHPEWHSNAQVVCACGKTYTLGSTKPLIHVELCSNCHPFYTGEQRFVDAASRIQKFQQKQTVAQSYVSKKIKKQEDQKKRESGPKTLREMLQGMK